MLQTVRQIGNSAGILIPAKILNKLGISRGEQVLVELNSSDQIVISKADADARTTLTPEFDTWLKAFNKEYGEALKKLANK